jgi:transketolase
MLLYSLLHLTGYPLSLDQVKQFRQWQSMTPGHPESELTPGVEVTTGPLGQGFANGVGMAIAEAHLAARFNRPGFPIINHYTYGIVSDGDLMEGVAAEAASIAGHLKLGKLIYFYDSNLITLSASTQATFTEDHAKRFEALRWHTQTVHDGNDLDALDRALQNAKNETERPSLIIVRTHIGYGSPHKQDTYEAHGSPLGEEEVRLTKKALGWPTEEPFYIPPEAEQHFRQGIQRGKAAEREWNDLYARYKQQFPQLGQELDLFLKAELPRDWAKGLPQFSTDIKGMATRAASGKVLQVLCQNLPGLIGGSADLNPSTYTELKEKGSLEPPSLAAGDLQGSAAGGWSYGGRNLYYGVREHAMGSITNGLATVSGIIPFASTFLIFSDYMRPSIRLAALMHLQVIYVFTHDSIGLGEDGPTHQPVEHLPSLRAIPRLIVLRPCDANETVIAWQVAIEAKHRPVALILSRQAVPTLDRSKYGTADGVRLGAYIISEASGGMPKLILIASGSEVSFILAAKERLEQQGIPVRCVSMPSWDLFEVQTQEYKNSVLPPEVSARLAVEAGSPLGWDRYVGSNGAVIGVTRFGASAPGETLMREYGFSVDNVCARALALLKL